jgi:hypothetical protein
MTWPNNPNQYQFNPWTDPNGIQWIYNATKTRWARYRVASTSGGADLSDATPAALGVESSGTSAEASRSDHVHAMPSAADVGAATAAQGALAASAVQPGDLATATVATATNALYAGTAESTASLATGTISGVTTIASGTTWSYADATAQTAHLTALGFGAAGLAIVPLGTPEAVRNYLGTERKKSTGTWSVTNSNAVTDVTGMSFTLEANTDYKIEWTAIVNSSGSGGLRMYLRVPSSDFNSTSTNGSGIVFAADTTPQSAYWIAALDLALYARITLATGPRPIGGYAIFRTGATGGTAKIVVAQWTATSGVTIEIASGKISASITKLSP